MLRGGAYSAIFTDVSLPGGSGLDALKMFRHLHPRTPAMVLTGQFDQAHALMACVLRAQYVVMPISLAAIEAFVTQPVSFDKAMADVLDKWRVRCGLSDAEVGVLHRVACGDTVSAIAEARGTAVSTLVTQLGSTCRKTRDDSSGKMIARLLREVAGQPSSCADFPLRRRPNAPHLSERERDVVMRLSLGNSNKEIAYDLGIAHATVRTLSRRANAKLGIADRRSPQGWVEVSEQTRYRSRLPACVTRLLSPRYCVNMYLVNTRARPNMGAQHVREPSGHPANVDAARPLSANTRRSLVHGSNSLRRNC